VSQRSRLVHERDVSVNARQLRSAVRILPPGNVCCDSLHNCQIALLHNSLMEGAICDWLRTSCIDLHVGADGGMINEPAILRFLRRGRPAHP
jgi:hypothetical protein